MRPEMTTTQTVTVFLVLTPTEVEFALANAHEVLALLEDEGVIARQERNDDPDDLQDLITLGLQEFIGCAAQRTAMDKHQADDVSDTLDDDKIPF